MQLSTTPTIAKWNKRIAVAFAAIGLYYYEAIQSEPWIIALVFGVVALFLSSAQGMKIQALEWELAEVKNERGTEQ